MSTRGAWGFRLNDKDYVTYNHFDSYPTGLGADFVKAIDGHSEDTLRALAGNIEFVSPGYDVTPDEFMNGDYWMIDNHDFLADSLFCEWAYIVNLDDSTFEVYKGFNQNPHAMGRYAHLQRERGGDYYGVALIAAIPLDELTTDMVESLDNN